MLGHIVSDSEEDVNYEYENEPEDIWPRGNSGCPILPEEV